MKVIARTANGYLVEATADELANAAGYNSAYGAPGAIRRDGQYSYEYAFPIGTEIKPAATHVYLQKLREHEEKCKSSAAFLRGMADMLDAAMPTTIVPPEPEDKIEKKG